MDCRSHDIAIVFAFGLLIGGGRASASGHDIFVASDDHEPAVVGWFRLDADRLGTHLWAGASHDVGGLSVATDFVVTGSHARFDAGPAFLIGNLGITPMLRATFDFAAKDIVAVVPQLYAVYAGPSLYVEMWNQALRRIVVRRRHSGSYGSEQGTQSPVCPVGRQRNHTDRAVNGRWTMYSARFAP